MKRLFLFAAASLLVAGLAWAAAPSPAPAPAPGNAETAQQAVPVPADGVGETLAGAAVPEPLSNDECQEALELCQQGCAPHEWPCLVACMQAYQQCLHIG
jgi:hypothetical protein